jgi:hypothetical protein
VWGALHELRFRGLSRAHPGLGPFPYGGAPHAVLAAGYSSGDPFAVSLAATARFAVDTATLDIALTALARASPRRTPSRSSLDGWLAGRFALLATRRLEVEDRQRGKAGARAGTLTAPVHALRAVRRGAGLLCRGARAPTIPRSRASGDRRRRSAQARARAGGDRRRARARS